MIVTAIEAKKASGSSGSMPKIVVPAASTMVPAGGIATNGIDYEKLGAQTAQMAIKIIKGKKASAIPVQLPKDITLVVNKKLAKVFKIDPAQVVNDAK